MRVAVLDDYQGVALHMADWSAVAQRASITVFRDHLANTDALLQRLAPFEIVCIMRERTPFPRAVMERLPLLKLIASTGPVNAAIDSQAAQELGIEVAFTGYSSTPTIELTWTILLALARNLVHEVNAVRGGGWQQGIGVNLAGKTLAVLGLGNIGSEVARIGCAFGMRVIAWSEHLTPEAAAAGNATWVSKEELFAQADFLCIHTVLSRRTRGLVDASMLALMKPTAYLLNLSRGPVVDESALLAALREGRLAGAGIDTFEQEPLPADHPFRSMPNVLTTPHIGYVTQELYRTFYGDCVRNILAWLSRPEQSGQSEPPARS